MKTDSIKVSVTVPALNEEQNIERLLQSFDDQTVGGFEVIIVDNGSTDETKSIVTKHAATAPYPLTLMEETKKGVGYARKCGMDDAASRKIEYLAGTDADSEVPPNWIEKILNTFEVTKADCLFGGASFDWSLFEQHPEIYELVTRAFRVRQVFYKEVYAPPRGVNFAITTNMYETVGGMPQPLNAEGQPQPGEDVKLHTLVHEAGGTIVTLDCLVSTSQRRVLQAVINNSPHNYYKDIGDIRLSDEELIEMVSKLPFEDLEQFIGVTYDRMFLNFLYKNVESDKWEHIQKFFAPNEDEFLHDYQNMSEEELSKKYRQTIIENALKLERS